MKYAIDKKAFKNRIPKNFDPLSTEMEAFSLLYTAKKLNKNAACLMTVVDSIFKESHATAAEREKGLDKMITLALESL